ncbi:hypothetical protein UF64_03790 [Thalassospira sp. HJ]|uniref:hypothetical protein n=1 Tax=Thalassospira sp. HJ TaxID=1616823 RepID=UPI0005CDDF31|nr:hypothetical protein [Thalassospira sp. HJ]KJE36793.1 hypothetical protein UF64_03790 [Thalassospira sp. HJ]
MTFNSRSFDDLDALYAKIRGENREAIIENDIVVDPLPLPGELRWGISTVFRPKLSTELWRDISELRNTLGNAHAAYDQSSVHVTVRSNEGFRPNIADDDHDVVGYADAMQAAIEDYAPLEVSFKGLIGVRTGVLLCGYPHFDLIELRRRYFLELEARKLIRPGPEPTIEKVRNTCHASMIMFSELLSDPKKFASHLDKLVDRDYGTVVIDEFDIVSYSRTLSDIKTATHATVPARNVRESSLT